MMHYDIRNEKDHAAPENMALTDQFPISVGKTGQSLVVCFKSLS